MNEQSEAARMNGTGQSAGWASDILGEINGELEVIVDRLVRNLDGEALQAAKRALDAMRPLLSEPTITTLAHLDVPNAESEVSE